MIKNQGSAVMSETQFTPFDQVKHENDSVNNANVDILSTKPQSMFGKQKVFPVPHSLKNLNMTTQ